MHVVRSRDHIRGIGLFDLRRVCLFVLRWIYFGQRGGIDRRICGRIDRGFFGQVRNWASIIVLWTFDGVLADVVMIHATAT